MMRDAPARPPRAAAVPASTDGSSKLVPESTGGAVGSPWKSDWSTPSPWLRYGIGPDRPAAQSAARSARPGRATGRRPLRGSVADRPRVARLRSRLRRRLALEERLIDALSVAQVRDRPRVARLRSRLRGRLALEERLIDALSVAQVRDRPRVARLRSRLRGRLALEERLVDALSVAQYGIGPGSLG